MVGRNGEVRGAAFDHTQHRGEHSSDCADLATVLIAGGGQRVVVPEQLVCAVDQINVQDMPPRTTLYERWRINQLMIGPSDPVRSRSRTGPALPPTPFVANFKVADDPFTRQDRLKLRLHLSVD